MTKRSPVVLVTGASSGIGHAVARAFAAKGFEVFGTSRNPRNTEPIAGVELIQLDVTDPESVTAAVSTVIQRAGRIDILVNNAGFGVLGAAEESSTAQAQQLFDTNFFGLVRVTREVLPHLRAQRSGRIINIGSVLGFLPAPYGALYSASKHAVEGYSESLDHELRTRGIRVSVIEPAYTKTSFDANYLEPDAKLDEYREAREGVTKRVNDVMATAEQPDVVADTVLEAASAARPKLRYAAGKLAKRLRLLRRFAPAGLVDAGIRKDLRLDAAMVSQPPRAARAF